MPNLYYYTKNPPLYIVFYTSTVVYIILDNIEQVLLCICGPYDKSKCRMNLQINPETVWIKKRTW